MKENAAIIEEDDAPEFCDKCEAGLVTYHIGGGYEQTLTCDCAAGLEIDERIADAKDHYVEDEY